MPISVVVSCIHHLLCHILAYQIVLLKIIMPIGLVHLLEFGSLVSFTGASYLVRNLNQETAMVINTTNNDFINNTAVTFGTVCSIEVLLDQKSQSFFRAQL